MAAREVTDLLDALSKSLAEARAGTPVKATSMRLPESVHRAALLATEMGMDESLTQATAAALIERVRAFVRTRALADHFVDFPEDAPRLADVAQRRVEGTDHPAASHPELVAEASAWVERRDPDWAVTGEVDDAVDRVLDYVEMLAAGVGERGRNTA